MVFNQNGMTTYGDHLASNAVSLGNNRILTWHKIENTKLVELQEKGIQVVKEWVNLAEIQEVAVLNMCGTEGYVTNSPNRNKPVCIIAHSVEFTPLAKSNTATTIKSVLSLED